jgi:GntR family transcriptional regulator, transcriptional repressor for pyruvate dehydrogenase complex
VLRPVHRRSVPDEVFDQLVEDIVAGELQAGQALPSERQLAEVLGVSRPAVREALQRLAQAGLIEVRQGETTTVRDYQRSAGLDLLPRLLTAGGTPDLDVVRSILEVRLTLAPDVARRCAQRRDDEVVARLRSHLTSLEGVAGDPGQAQLLVHQLWDAIVDGSGNLVYRLLFNALQAAYLPAMELLTHALAEELGDLAGYRDLVEAIDRQDAAQAAATARRVVGRGTAGATALLAQLADVDDQAPGAS